MTDGNLANLVLALTGVFALSLAAACTPPPAATATPGVTSPAPATALPPGGVTPVPPATAAVPGSTVNPAVVFSLASVPTACPANFVVDQTEGTYYKAGSPERAELVEAGVSGTPVTLTGYVFDKDCRPIAGAWIDFWQADGNGNYDNAGYRLRGHQFTDATGKYTLHTVIPGEYPGRTPHIHVKLARTGATGSITTTQLYFPEAAQNATDGLFNAAMLVTLGRDAEGRSIAFFNFKLNQ